MVRKNIVFLFLIICMLSSISFGHCKIAYSELSEDESGVFEDNFDNSENWNCFGSVEVNLYDEILWLFPYGDPREGYAEHNGLIYESTEDFYKISVQISGLCSLQSGILVQITSDNWENSYDIITVSLPGSYNKSATWDIPPYARGNKLDVKMYMSSQSPVVPVDVYWIKIVYWYGIPNNPPIAFIDSIYPNPANYGDLVTFHGHGEDPDGYITDYKWESNIDGFLSDQSIFSSSSLSIGSHIISFSVKDDDEMWSEPDTESLNILDPSGPPSIEQVLPYFADGSEGSSGDGLILQGMNLTNEYTAFVSGTDISWVRFEFDILGTYTDYDGSDGWTATFNSKDIINPYSMLIPSWSRNLM